jgi:hypothetical protein
VIKTLEAQVGQFLLGLQVPGEPFPSWSGKGLISTPVSSIAEVYVEVLRIGE